MRRTLRTEFEILAVVFAVQKFKPNYLNPYKSLFPKPVFIKQLFDIQ